MQRWRDEEASRFKAEERLLALEKKNEKLCNELENEKTSREVRHQAFPNPQTLENWNRLAKLAFRSTSDIALANHLLINKLTQLPS